MPSHDLTSDKTTVSQPDRVDSDAQRKRADEKAKTERRRMEARQQQLKEIRDQVDAPMPDATPPEEDETVQQYERQLLKVRETLGGFLNEYEEAVEQAENRVEEAENALVEAEAKKEIGEADASDVETAEEALDAAEAELEEAREELQQAKDERLKLTRKEQILEDRLSEARQKAQHRFEKEITEAVREQTQAVVNAMEKARAEAEKLFVMRARLSRAPVNLVKDLHLTPPHCDKLPLQPAVQSKPREDVEKLFQSLDLAGVEVPRFEKNTGEYVPPLDDREV